MSATPYCDYFAYWKPWQRKRFLAKIDRRGEDECWPWLGYIDPQGYGRVHLPTLGRPVQAHRAVWAYFNGQEPGEAFICHDCDNPICVNPGHLYAGTPQSNMDDKMSRDRANWQCGERNRLAKLTAKKVIAARRRYLNGETMGEIAATMGVSVNTMRKAINGEKWAHVPDYLDVIEFQRSLRT